MLGCRPVEHMLTHGQQQHATDVSVTYNVIADERTLARLPVAGQTCAAVRIEYA